MSSPTTPITDPVRPAADTDPVRPAAEPTALAGADPVGFAAELSRSERSSGIDITESAPPAEVLDQMARADTINSRLRAEGHELSFSLSADGCALEIDLRDSTGRLLRTISAAEAVQIAAGQPIG